MLASKLFLINQLAKSLSAKLDNAKEKPNIKQLQAIKNAFTKIANASDEIMAAVKTEVANRNSDEVKFDSFTIKNADAVNKESIKHLAGNIKEGINNQVDVMGASFLASDNQYNAIEHIANFIENPDEQALANGLAISEEKLAQHWQGDLQKNTILAKRALQWLGLPPIKQINVLDFLDKMVAIGKLCSEDSNLKNSLGSGSMSKEDALATRQKLCSNSEFLQAIYNKTHLKHKESLKKLQQLNSIIAKRN